VTKDSALVKHRSQYSIHISQGEKVTDDLAMIGLCYVWKIYCSKLLLKSSKIDSVDVTGRQVELRAEMERKGCVYLYKGSNR